jgi:transposase, IS5 family
MKQLGLNDSGFVKHPKKTRKAQFLAEMNQVVPWSRLVALIEPHYPKPGNGRRPISLETMLRIHFMQQWFAYSDPAMEEALHDIPLLREFAGLDATVEAIPDETTILKFRHLLERHGLAGALLEEINALLGERGLILRKGTMVDATLIAAPTSTKNAQGKRDPEMSSTKKGNQWYFGMKAHVGVDTAHGLVHTVVGTAAKVPDVKVTDTLLHGEEHEVHGDKGYTTRERNLTASDPASGPLWCFPFKRQRGKDLPEWKREINIGCPSFVRA